MYILQQEICHQSLKEKKTPHNLWFMFLINQLWNPEQHNDSTINDRFYWYWVRNIVPVEEKGCALILRLYVIFFAWFAQGTFTYKVCRHICRNINSCLSVEFDNKCLESWGYQTYMEYMYNTVPVMLRLMLVCFCRFVKKKYMYYWTVAVAINLFIQIHRFFYESAKITYIYKHIMWFVSLS